MEPIEIIRKYNNQPHVRGTVDCNLLCLEIHEPEMYTNLVGRYTTIVGGVRAAKKHTGFTSIRDLLENSNYEEIDPNYQLPYDVVVFDDCHDVYISMGNKWFGVVGHGDDGIFSMTEKSKQDKCKVYRKISGGE